MDLDLECETVSPIKLRKVLSKTIMRMSLAKHYVTLIILSVPRLIYTPTRPPPRRVNITSTNPFLVGNLWRLLGVLLRLLLKYLG